MVTDVIGSLVLQEAGSRLRERRNNAKANQAFLRNPRKLNSVISTIGSELLTESQLEGVDQKVFRRDPLAALDSAFNESDPRRGSLTKIREGVRKFISDPNNAHISPERIISKAFESEQRRASPELTRLFKEKGLFGGDKFEPDVDIRFPSSIGVQAIAEQATTNPGDAGGFDDVVGAAIKGAVLTPAENLGTNVALATLGTGTSAFIARRARKGVRGRTAVGRGIQKAALVATGKRLASRGLAGKAGALIAGAASFIPHPAAKVGGKLIASVLTGLGTLSVLDAGTGAVREALKEGSPGFVDNNPVVTELLSLGLGGGSAVLVKSMATKLLTRNALVSDFKGSAKEVIDIGNVEKSLKKDSANLLDDLTNLNKVGAKKAAKLAKKELAKAEEGLANANTNTSLVLREAQKLITQGTPKTPGPRDLVPPVGQIGKTVGVGTTGKGGVLKVSSVPFKGGKTAQSTRVVTQTLDKDIAEITRPQGLLTSGKSVSKEVADITTAKITGKGSIGVVFSKDLKTLGLPKTLATPGTLRKSIEKKHPDTELQITTSFDALSKGTNAFKVEVFHKGTSTPVGKEKTQQVLRSLEEGLLEAAGTPKTLGPVISPLTKILLKKEAAQIKKLGVKQTKRKLSIGIVKVKSDPQGIKVVSAGDEIGASSTATRDRARIMTNPDIPELTRAEMNKSFINLKNRGFSDSAASQVIVDMAATLKKEGKLITKSASNIFEREASIAAARQARLKPAKTETTKFAVTATDELDDVLSAGASKLGKTVEELTLQETLSLASKSGKALAIIGTAIAAGALLPEDSEASVISSLGKVAATAGQKIESNALKNSANKILRKKGESDSAMIARLQAQTKKIPAETINNSDKRSAKLTFNAKTNGFNLDRETVRKANVGFLDKAFGSVFNNFRQMGPVGEVLTNKFIQVDDISEISTKAAVKQLRNGLPISKITGKQMTNLPKEPGKNVHDIMTGKITKAPQADVETALHFREWANTIFQYAEAQGVPVVGFRQNYFPQILKTGILDTDAGKARLITHLLETGQVSSLTKAFEVTKSMIRDPHYNVFNKLPRKTNVKKAGSLEKSRKFDLPPELYLGGDGKHVLEALSSYANQVTLRVGRIQAFGVKNERLEPVIKRLVKNGESEVYIRQAISVMQGEKPASFKAPALFNKAIGISRAFEALDLLGYAGISQLGQISVVVSKAGYVNTLKGIKNFVTSQKNKELVDSSAAVAETMSRHILGQFGATAGIAKTVTETALRAYGVLGADRLGRTLAASVGGEYALSLSKRLVKTGLNASKESKFLQRQLKELGLSPSIMLKNIKAGKTAFTDDNLKVVMKRFSDNTQFRSRPGDLPLWFASDHAKMITQFKSFLFQSGSAINQLLIKEAKLGNVAPLARALSVSPFIGAGIQSIRGELREILTGEGNTFRDKQIKKGKFLTEPRDWMGGSSISRVWNDATYTLALGVIPDITTEILSSRGLGKGVLGPNVDRLVKANAAIFKDIEEGDVKHVTKELKKLAPFGINN